MSVLGGSPVVLMGRPANGRNWLILQLEGTRSNRDGLGAKIRIGNQHGYAATGGSYLSASDKRVHFGLGSQPEVTVEIVWPGGRTQRMEKAPANRILRIKEE